MEPILVLYFTACMVQSAQSVGDEFQRWNADSDEE